MDSSFQLIDEDGNFNETGMENFSNAAQLSECGRSYSVISIFGPQSSGKSTLLNHLFETNFTEMDDNKGRSKTTNGIWLAKCLNIEPCILVIDIEGNDGSQQQEVDTAFEKRSALFALAVSDIVLINMWCTDIGRENGGGRPLLKTILEMIMRLFHPRRTTVVFVIRDKSRKENVLPGLEKILKEDIEKLYASVPKPRDHTETPLSDFFNVEVIFLSSYDHCADHFKTQVADMKQRLVESIDSGRLGGGQPEVAHASVFSKNIGQIWDDIKKEKDLDLPAIKILVANTRCDEIANERFDHLAQSEDWLRLEENARSHLVLGFGNDLSSIIQACLSTYEEKVDHFDEVVRTTKRQRLQERVLELVKPAYKSTLEHLHLRTLDHFKQGFENALNQEKSFVDAAQECRMQCMSEFIEGCRDANIAQAHWDSSEDLYNLRLAIDAHVDILCGSKLSEIKSDHEERLEKAISKGVEASFRDKSLDDIWPAIRNLLQHETDHTTSLFSYHISGFGIDETTRNRMIGTMTKYARIVVQTKARENAQDGRILMLMERRFTRLFFPTTPRNWTGEEDIQMLSREACYESMKLLSVMAIDRLDGDGDNILQTLSAALLDFTSATADDLLASDCWEEIPSVKTLITPARSKTLWTQFKASVDSQVRRAIIAQTATDVARNEASNAAVKMGRFKNFQNLAVLSMGAMVVLCAGVAIPGIAASAGVPSIVNTAMPGIVNAATGLVTTVGPIFNPLATGVASPRILRNVYSVVGTVLGVYMTMLARNVEN